MCTGTTLTEFGLQIGQCGQWGAAPPTAAIGRSAVVGPEAGSNGCFQNLSMSAAYPVLPVRISFVKFGTITGVSAQAAHKCSKGGEITDESLQRIGDHFKLDFVTFKCAKPSEYDANGVISGSDNFFTASNGFTLNTKTCRRATRRWSTRCLNNKPNCAVC